MNSIPAEAIVLPAIHDAESIQQALSIVIQAVAAGTLDNTRARILLSALKLAMTNLRTIAAENASQEKQQLARQEEASGTSTLPVVTATQSPENAPKRYPLSVPNATSTAYVPPASHIRAAKIKAMLHARAMSR